MKIKIESTFEEEAYSSLTTSGLAGVGLDKSENEQLPHSTSTRADPQTQTTTDGNCDRRQNFTLGVEIALESHCIIQTCTGPIVQRVDLDGKPARIKRLLNSASLSPSLPRPNSERLLASGSSSTATECIIDTKPPKPKLRPTLTTKRHRGDKKTVRFSFYTSIVGVKRRRPTDYYWEERRYAPKCKRLRLGDYNEEISTIIPPKVKEELSVKSERSFINKSIDKDVKTSPLKTAEPSCSIDDKKRLKLPTPTSNFNDKPIKNDHGDTVVPMEVDEDEVNSVSDEAKPSQESSTGSKMFFNNAQDFSSRVQLGGATSLPDLPKDCLQLVADMVGAKGAGRKFAKRFLPYLSRSRRR